jgi:hypothetical protein
MEDSLEQSLAVDVLAASLRMDKQESGDLLEFLAKKLQQSLPKNTQIKRGGFFGTGEIQQITIYFDENYYQINRERYGSFTAKVIKVVRGVVIKTTEIPMEQWNDELALELSRLAQHSAQMRDALNKFVIG